MSNRERTQLSGRGLPSYKALRLREIKPVSSPPIASEQQTPISLTPTDNIDNTTETKSPNNDDIDDIDDIDLDTYQEDADEIIDPFSHNNTGNDVLTYDSDDDSDEDLLLQREMQKIREYEMKHELTEAKEKQAIETDSYLISNPLMAEQLADIIKGEKIEPGATLESSNNNLQQTKRSWTEDSVFSNQAAGLDPRGTNKKQRYLNDTTRSGFHQEFLRSIFK